MTNPLARLWRRVRTLLHWRSHNADLAEEIAFHFEKKREHFASQGMSPADATAAAHRALGNMTAVRESSRSVWLASWVESVWQDVTFGIRSLRSQPMFAVVAIVGLIGGLGLSAAAFGGFSAFALRGWDTPEAERMVALYATAPGAPTDRFSTGFSLDQVEAFEARARSIDGVIAWDRTRPDGSGGITAAPVRAGYFAVLGIPMARGREFTPDEDRVGAPHAVIVLSHRYWETMLDARADVIGSVVRVKGVAFTVIGVAAPGFAGTDMVTVDAWIPLTAMTIVQPRNRRSVTALSHSDECCVSVAARVAAGTSPDAVAAELTAVLAQTRRPGIDTLVRSVVVAPFTIVGSSGPVVKSEVIPVFLLIGGGVGAVLLLACANVANLLLARATARQREIRIRLALGASRGRLVRQLMTESLLLALLAGIPALVIARYVPTVVMKTITTLPINLSFTTNITMVLFTVGLAVVSCVMFGLAPALYATQSAQIQRRQLPLRSVFLSAQVVFCLVLLVSAGLFLRQIRVEQSADLGFATSDVSELTIFVPGNEDEAAHSARLATVLPDLAAAVGLSQVSYKEFAPFQRLARPVHLPQRDGADMIAVTQASAEYFPSMDIRVLAGRVYANGPSGANEVIVNAALADQLGGAIRAIGATLVIDSIPRTVVGVIPTIHDIGIRDKLPAVYQPLTWTTAPRILVRGNPDGARRLAEAIMSRDPSLTATIRPYSWYLTDALGTSMFAASVAGAMGILALVLASVGMFGVFSYWVGQRTHDISVRMALGATTAHVLRLVLSSSAKAVGWGIVIGIPAAAGAAQLLRSALYGLHPFDPVAFGTAIGLLVSCALAATAIPAWRAVHVQPMSVLRND